MLIYSRQPGRNRRPVTKAEPPKVATPAKDILQKRKPGRPKGSKSKKGKRHA